MIQALMIKQAPSRKRKGRPKVFEGKGAYVLTHKAPQLLFRHPVRAACATLNALPVAD
jgi:hypothetical protein